MSMMSSMSRMRGQERGPGYIQTETLLGDSMQKFGRELGEESNFGTLFIIRFFIIRFLPLLRWDILYDVLKVLCKWCFCKSLFSRKLVVTF